MAAGDLNKNRSILLGRPDQTGKDLPVVVTVEYAWYSTVACRTKDMPGKEYEVAATGGADRRSCYPASCIKCDGYTDFCPYKKLLDIPRRRTIAGSITIVWADDNYGYIRQLPTVKPNSVVVAAVVFVIYLIGASTCPELPVVVCYVAGFISYRNMSKSAYVGADKL